MSDITTFIAGLEALDIDGVTMLDKEPLEKPDGLPVAWVALPTIIGQPPQTIANSAIRQRRYRALVLVAVELVRQGEQKEHFDALLAYGQAVATALDAAQFGYRLEYEIAVDRAVKIGTENYYGIAAVVTGDR